MLPVGVLGVQLWVSLLHLGVVIEIPTLTEFRPGRSLKNGVGHLLASFPFVSLPRKVHELLELAFWVLQRGERRKGSIEVQGSVLLRPPLAYGLRDTASESACALPEWPEIPPETPYLASFPNRSFVVSLQDKTTRRQC
jgi:hypothetical protein